MNDMGVCSAAAAGGAEINTAYLRMRVGQGPLQLPNFVLQRHPQAEFALFVLAEDDKDYARSGDS
jgi:hypothetical protein